MILTATCGPGILGQFPLATKTLLDETLHRLFWALSDESPILILPSLAGMLLSQLLVFL